MNDSLRGADDQISRAELFRRLHHGPDVLILPNAWDVASARLFATIPGARAIATTSAGIAAAHGRPDGQDLGADEMLAAVASIAGATRLPVTADLEAGYGDTADQVARVIAGALDAGAVGVNLEDGDAAGQADHPLTDLGLHAGKVAAARQVADERAVPLVVNARTDTYWLGAGDPATRLDETIRRLRAYRDAGADCLFVPGYPPADAVGEQTEHMIAELLSAVEGTPVNLLATTALPAVGRLNELGVRRLSVGSGPYRLALAAARDAMAELVGTGDTGALGGAVRLPYPRLKDLLLET